MTPLDQETRTILNTEEAAYHLNRQPQTLRVWHHFKNGPINPVKINGRLGWRTEDIRKLLAG